MQIIDLRPEDGQAVQQAATLLVDVFPPDAWPDIASGLEEVREMLGPDRISRLAVDGQGMVLGWIGGIREYNGHTWQLHPLVVHPEHQGRGIGRALVLDLERLVRERGGMTIYLGTDDPDHRTNLGGIDLYPDIATYIKHIKNLRRHPYEFYQKLGYVIYGLLPDANGFGKPDILMAKRVGQPDATGESAT
jgi:aminoglycoside 6'-N-acetyltransferase I